MRTSACLSFPMKVLKSLFIGFAFISQITVYASYAPSIEPKFAPRTCGTVQECIIYYSDKYNVSASLMAKVIYCESSNNPNAVGDNGTSFGVSQIHLPAHPHVTKEQAKDIPFAVEFMAKAFANGDEWMWSCYRIVDNGMYNTK